MKRLAAVAADHRRQVMTPGAEVVPILPGQYWPAQCGWYAGIMLADDKASAWHLVLPDGPEHQLGRLPWGHTSKMVPGAGHRNDGHANTLAMLKAGNALAQAVRALPGDCHVPSRGESALLYATLEAQFEPGWYWTSTQSSANYAFIQYFDYGLQYGHGKGYEGRCRAVRRLVLESFNPLMAAR